MQPDNEAIGKLISEQDERFRQLCQDLIAAGARPNIIREITNLWCQLDESAGSIGQRLDPRRVYHEGSNGYLSDPPLRGMSRGDYDQLYEENSPRLNIPQLIVEQAEQLHSTLTKFGAQIEQYTTTLQAIARQRPADETAPKADAAPLPAP